MWRASSAKNIERTLRGEDRKTFRYRDKGMMATIGRAAAVAVIGKRYLTGLIAWLAWLFVHLVFLIGFRNRVLVLLQWAWSYLSWQRGARLITGELGSHLAHPDRVPGETDEDVEEAEEVRATILARREARQR